MFKMSISLMLQHFIIFNYYRGLRLAEVLKCPHDRNNLRATIDCIRSKDANEIVNREWDGIVFGIAEFPFTPIIDGAFLDETPAKSLETKNFKKCNIMTGANKDEGVFFIMYYLTELFKNEESVLVDREDFIRSVGELNLYVKNVSTDSEYIYLGMYLCRIVDHFWMSESELHKN